MISGLTTWGIYVELRANKCEGMIPLRDMPGDSFKFDQAKYTVIGQRTGRRIRLGDELLVTIRGVDMDKRTVDLGLATGSSNNDRSASPSGATDKRGTWDETRPSSAEDRAGRKRAQTQSRERQRRSLGRGRRK